MPTKFEVTTIGPIGIGGHKYFAQVEHGIIEGQFVWNLLQTECEGRWPMSDCATGDVWLDKLLAYAIEAYFDC